MSGIGADGSLDCLPREDAQVLLDAGQTRFIPARSTLCEEGQATGCCFVVTAGSFGLVKQLGGRSTTLSTAGAGSVLALMPAFDGAPCAVTITCLDDATVVEVTRQRLLDLVAGDGTANLALAAMLARLAIRRLRQATSELAQALCAALQAEDQAGRLDALRLARIQAAGYAWQDD